MNISTKKQQKITPKDILIVFLRKKMIKDRFTRKIIRKARKDGTIKGEVYVDLLYKPYLLQQLYEAGLTNTRGTTLQQVLKVVENSNVEPDVKEKIRKRLERLEKHGWLKRKVLTREEKKYLKINSNAKRYIYFLSKQSINYLKTYRSFINPEGYLIKSKTIQSV